ncbi:hypothetical protein [Kitasatospora sp. NPDC059327]|uniref:hypothetical protein n=1 Tax=Kitasatospora sp. NPDC059327 TaxID=3346803 RepID=UPI0036B14FBC
MGFKQNNNFKNVGSVNNFDNNQGTVHIGGGSQAAQQTDLQAVLRAVLEEVERARSAGTLSSDVAGHVETQVREAALAASEPDADAEAVTSRLTAVRQFLVGTAGAPAIVSALATAINTAHTFF